MGRIIGITGTTGSGKSTVSRIMQNLGAYIIDADVVAKTALAPSSPIVPLIRKAFGDEVMQDDNVIDRRKLSNKVFSDYKELNKLNSITLPYIKNEMLKQANDCFKKDNNKLVVFDAPLLFEAGLNEGLDDIWLVTAADEMKRNRIMERDNLTADEAIQRINSRKSDDEMKKLSTVIIENNGSYDELLKKVTDIFSERYGITI